MKIFNVIDERGRFVQLKFDDTNNGQFDSHTFSYLGARKQYKEMGDEMGFDSVYGNLVEPIPSVFSNPVLSAS